MSVIFKALNKMQTGPGISKGIEQPGLRERSSLKRVIFSPLAAILIALLIIGAGFACVYGFSYFKQKYQARLSKKIETAGTPLPAAATDQQANIDSIQSTDIGAIQENGEIPPPPMIPEDDPADIEKSFNMPKSQATRQQSSRAFKKMQYNPSVVKKQSGDLTITRENAGALAENSKKIKFSKKRKPPQKNVAHKKDLELIAKKSRIYQEEFQKEQVPGKITRPRMKKTSRPATPQKAMNTKDAQIKQHKADLKQNRRVLQLVAKIQNALINQDEKKGNELIRKLTLIKGEENRYVLKIKAYQLLRQKNYADAEILLKKIILKQENDLEAGVNLIIVEINTNQLDSARQRLNRLEELFPENPKIIELKQRFNWNY